MLILEVFKLSGLGISSTWNKKVQFRTLVSVGGLNYSSLYFSIKSAF